MSIWKVAALEFANIAQKADNFADFIKRGGKFVRHHIGYKNPGAQRLAKEFLVEMGNRVDRLKILGQELSNADYFFRRFPDQGILSGFKKQPHLEVVGPGSTTEGIGSLFNYQKLADDVAYTNRHNINLEHEKYLELENKFINTMLDKVHLMSAKDFDDFLFRVKEFRRIGNSMSSTAKGDELIDNPALHDLALKNRDLRIKGPPDDEIHSINKFIENVVNDPEGFYKIGPLLDQPFGIPSDRWLTFHKGSKGTKVPGEGGWGKGPGRFSAEEEIVTEGGNPFIAEEGIKGLQKEVVTEIRSPFRKTGIETLEQKQTKAYEDLMKTGPKMNGDFAHGGRIGYRDGTNVFDPGAIALDELGKEYNQLRKTGAIPLDLGFEDWLASYADLPATLPEKKYAHGGGVGTLFEERI